MIVTVTLNPSLRVHYEAERIEAGALNPVGRVRHEAGGRGLTVARLLTKFGHEVVAAGFAGGSTGELIRNELAQAGVAGQFTRITAESRRVVRVSDAAACGLVTGFAEPAPYITTEELGRFAADYRALLDGATAVVLCGSLPAGLPEDIYGSLTSYARGSGVPVILDAAGNALRHGAARGPALVIPGHASDHPPELISADTLVLPGARLIRALTAAGEWIAQLPGNPGPVPGDPGMWRAALVAGLVPGVALGWSWPDMLRHAFALAGSVSAAGDVDLAVYEVLLPDVEVTGPRA